MGGFMEKILVIDDEPSIRGLLATLLERKGYDIYLADGGKKGIDVFKRERPAVTVLDLKMPDMDGLAVLQELRALDPAKPVIILSGARSEEFEVEARLF